MYDDWLNILASFSAILFVYLFISGIVMAIRKKPIWKKLLGLSVAVFVISIGFMSTAPDVTTDVYSDEKAVPEEEKVASPPKETEQQEEKKAEEKKDTKTADNQDKKTDKQASPPVIGKSDTKEQTAEKQEKAETETAQTNANQVPIEFVRVVDGDTAKVIYNGNEETVRYLLIDTPESKAPNSCVQPYGKEASARNEELLRSGKVTLEFDGPKRDKYDRLLAYVFVDGASVQGTLLKEGYARIAYIYDPPYKYLSQFQQNEKEAKNKGLRIWSISGYATDSGFNGCVNGEKKTEKSSSTSKQSQPEQQPSQPAKQPETQPSSENTQKESFKNCTELRKVYPQGVPKGHPAYQPKMDRDKDDYACEVS